jgi:hypothetical protein
MQALSATTPPSGTDLITHSDCNNSSSNNQSGKNVMSLE